MRIAVLLPLLLLLAACSNRVVSEKPWFTKAAEANAPHLKPGLWVAMKPPVETGNKPCRFDERKPMVAWPDCVSGYVVRDDDVLTLAWSETTERGRTVREYDWASRAHVVARGEPRIDQVEGCPGLLKAKEVAAPAEETAATADGELGAVAPAPAKAEPPDARAGSPPDAEPEDPYAYCYNAVRPTRFDTAGRITAVLTWPVFCGPWPTKARADKSGGSVTDAPFPGLQVEKNNCTAESEKALRGAAKASEAVAVSIHDGPVEAHWVRDGYR